MFVLRRSPGVIPVGTLEGFTGLDVSAQHVRATVSFRQPLESLLLSSSGARHDDCDHDDDENHASEDTADDWSERELATAIICVTLQQGCGIGGLSGCVG